MIYKHQMKGYDQVLGTWCHGGVFCWMVLFTAHMCWHMPYAVPHTIRGGGKNARKGTLVWCVRGTQPSVHLVFFSLSPSKSLMSSIQDIFTWNCKLQTMCSRWQ